MKSVAWIVVLLGIIVACNANQLFLDEDEVRVFTDVHHSVRDISGDSLRVSSHLHSRAASVGVGSSIMLIQMKNFADGTGGGFYSLHTVTGINATSGTITVNPPVNHNYPQNSTQLVVCVNSTSIVLGDRAQLTVTPWNGTIGGVLCLLTNNVTLGKDARIHADGAGYQGGDGASSGTFGEQGEGIEFSVTQSSSRTANGGGGGYYNYIGCQASTTGGGGGAMATSAGNAYTSYCTSSTVFAQGGAALPRVGQANYLFFGGGGGGGGRGTFQPGTGANGGEGGNGGGIVYLIVRENLVGDGVISANGRPGNLPIYQNGASLNGGLGGGGGGAGGSLFIQVLGQRWGFNRFEVIGQAPGNGYYNTVLQSAFSGSAGTNGFIQYSGPQCLIPLWLRTATSYSDFTTLDSSSQTVWNFYEKPVSAVSGSFTSTCGYAYSKVLSLKKGSNYQPSVLFVQTFTPAQGGTEGGFSFHTIQSVSGNSVTVSSVAGSPTCVAPYCQVVFSPKFQTLYLYPQSLLTSPDAVTDLSSPDYGLGGVTALQTEVLQNNGTIATGSGIRGGEPQRFGAINDRLLGYQGYSFVYRTVPVQSNVNFFGGGGGDIYGLTSCISGGGGGGYGTNGLAAIADGDCVNPNYGFGGVAYPASNANPTYTRVSAQDLNGAGATLFEGSGGGGAVGENLALSNVLVVTDCRTSSVIPGILTTDGHNVTTAYNSASAGGAAVCYSINAFSSAAALANYNLIIWEIATTANGNNVVVPVCPAVITVLTSYINAGGKLLIHGASGLDSNIVPFLGGVGSCLNCFVANQPIDSSVNSIYITTGFVDITGKTVNLNSTCLGNAPGLALPVSGLAVTLNQGPNGYWVGRTTAAGGRVTFMTTDACTCAANGDSLWSPVANYAANPPNAQYNPALRNIALNSAPKLLESGFGGSGGNGGGIIAVIANHIEYGGSYYAPGYNGGDGTVALGQAQNPFTSYRVGGGGGGSGGTIALFTTSRCDSISRFVNGGNGGQSFPVNRAGGGSGGLGRLSNIPADGRPSDVPVFKLDTLNTPLCYQQTITVNYTGIGCVHYVDVYVSDSTIVGLSTNRLQFYPGVGANQTLTVTCNRVKKPATITFKEGTTTLSTQSFYCQGQIVIPAGSATSALFGSSVSLPVQLKPAPSADTGAVQIAITDLRAPTLTALNSPLHFGVGQNSTTSLYQTTQGSFVGQTTLYFESSHLHEYCPLSYNFTLLGLISSDVNGKTLGNGLRTKVCVTINPPAGPQSSDPVVVFIDASQVGVIYTPAYPYPPVITNPPSILVYNSGQTVQCYDLKPTISGTNLPITYTATNYSPRIENVNVISSIFTNAPDSIAVGGSYDIDVVINPLSTSTVVVNIVTSPEISCPSSVSFVPSDSLQTIVCKGVKVGAGTITYTSTGFLTLVDRINVINLICPNGTIVSAEGTNCAACPSVNGAVCNLEGICALSAEDPSRATCNCTAGAYGPACNIVSGPGVAFCIDSIENPCVNRGTGQYPSYALSVRSGICDFPTITITDFNTNYNGYVNPSGTIVTTAGGVKWTANYNGGLLPGFLFQRVYYDNTAIAEKNDQAPCAPSTVVFQFSRTAIAGVDFADVELFYWDDWVLAEYTCPPASQSVIKDINKLRYTINLCSVGQFQFFLKRSFNPRDTPEIAHVTTAAISTEAYALEGAEEIGIPLQPKFTGVNRDPSPKIIQQLGNENNAADVPKHITSDQVVSETSILSISLLVILACFILQIVA